MALIETHSGETNEWRCTFESDSDGPEWQDHHLFSTTEEPISSMGRPASPGHPPYGTPTSVPNALLKRDEGTTENSKSRPYAKGTNNRNAGGDNLLNLLLQIGKTKQNPY